MLCLISNNKCKFVKFSVLVLRIRQLGVQPGPARPCILQNETNFGTINHKSTIPATLMIPSTAVCTMALFVFLLMYLRPRTLLPSAVIIIMS